VDSSQTPEPVEGAELVEAPREGTLAWLALQQHELVMGRELPACHRIPDGASFRSDAERGGRCALVRSDGSVCGAVATRRYGVCLVHCGGGASDLAEMSRQGAAKLARLRIRRELLGVGPRTAGNPRALARLAAAERAEELAAALLAPIGARGLGPLEQQRAAVAVLDATFPLQAATLEVEVPADAEGVGSMGWAEMQSLAAKLLGT